jgi:hypothetical protein
MDVVWIELIKTVPILVFSIARATNLSKWMERACLKQGFKNRLHPQKLKTEKLGWFLV